MLQVKTVPELNRQSFGFLEQATDGKITMLSPGSTARALIETVNQNIGQYYNALSLHHTMAYVTTATGVYLDLIAELFGISRRTAEAAFVRSSEPTSLQMVPYRSEVTTRPSRVTFSSFGEKSAAILIALSSAIDVLQKDWDSKTNIV